jgi:hypothetical protein
VTVTLPVHPLAGQPLAVVRWVNRRGTRYVELEHPQGWSIRVPVSWTDRGAPAVVSGLPGRPAALDVAGLRNLAAYVRGELDGSYDRATLTPGGEADSNLEQRRPRAVAGTTEPASGAGLGRSRFERSLAGARRSGVTPAQDDAGGFPSGGGRR